MSETKFSVAKLREKAERKRDEAQAKLDERNAKIVEAVQEFADELADPESDLTSERNITDQFAERLREVRGNDTPRSEFIAQIERSDRALVWLNMVADENVGLYDAPHEIKTLVEDF